MLGRVEAAPRVHQLSTTLDVDALGGVHHDLGHRGVVEELLDGSVAENILGDGAHQRVALIVGEGDVVFGHDPSKVGDHDAAQLIG